MSPDRAPEAVTRREGTRVEQIFFHKEYISLFLGPGVQLYLHYLSKPTEVFRLQVTLYSQVSGQEVSSVTYIS